MKPKLHQPIKLNWDMEKQKSHTAFMNLKNVIPEIEKVISGYKKHYWCKRKGFQNDEWVLQSFVYTTINEAQDHQV